MCTAYVNGGIYEPLFHIIVLFLYMPGIVALVGRVNVGKSTLFNRLVGEREAITDKVPGVTRNRKYGIFDWNGRVYTVVDTGGFIEEEEDPLGPAILQQLRVAMSEADLFFFVVDGQAGLLPGDEVLAKLLRESGKPVLVVVNKVDNPAVRLEAAAFHALGFPDIYPISSSHGNGTGELLDGLCELLPQSIPADSQQPHLPRIAFVGRPNVGKSTFINALLNQDRHIVSPIPNTTRDAIDSYYHLYDKQLILTDTAGLTRKGRARDLALYGVMRTLKAISRSDVCIVLADAEEGLTSQDMNILQQAEQQKKGMVLLVNKWDMVAAAGGQAQAYVKHLKEQLGSLSYVPVLLTSGLEKKNLLQTLDKAIEVYANKQMRIPTPLLNKHMLSAIERVRPVVRGKEVKIKYCVQLPGVPPAFAFFCNTVQRMPATYQRYVENQLRSAFGFEGVPLTLLYRKK